MQPIELDFKPSVFLTLIILLFSLGACAIVMTVLDAWLLKILLVLSILLYGAYTLCLQALLILPWSYIGISINSKNECRLRRKDGMQIWVTVSKSTVVTQYLTIIHIKVKKHKDEYKTRFNLMAKELVIVPDLVVNKDHYRQLRVWVRWGATRMSAEFN